MILSSVVTFARTQAQTNSDGLSDDNALIYANEALEDFHRQLVTRGVDASQLVETSILGVVNQGVYDYPSKPASVLALKTIELNYTDTTQSNYKVAQQVDVSNLPGQVSFNWLRANASPQNPQFDDRGDKFEIFPTPTSANDVTSLARLFYFAKPSIYTALANTVNYPENLAVGILGFRIAASYKYSLQGQDNYATGDKLNAKYQEQVNQYVENLGKGSQQPLQATPLPITGFQF